MARQPILYVGQSVADQLWDSVESNLDRYRDQGFLDLVASGNWSIPLHRDFDPSPLTELNADKGIEIELANSKRVWAALRTLTPALARENRLWVRLSHVECIEFCRSRWLSSGSDETLIKAIRMHFFANGRTAARDDHAIARLWWNSWIAHQVNPSDPDSALRAILTRADVRLSLVERPWMFARRSLAAAIVELMLAESWLTEKEAHFREFVKAANLLGGGIVFEALSKAEIESFLRHCLLKAQAAVAVAQRKQGAPA